MRRFLGSVATGALLILLSPGASAQTCTDSSRTLFAGGPGTGACTQLDGDPASCHLAWHASGGGTAASCFYTYQDNTCLGCGPNNESGGLCFNLCDAASPRCADPAKTVFSGGGSGAGACLFFDGDPIACNAAWHITGSTGQPANCFYDDGFCMGCGPNNEASGACVNLCAAAAPSCAEASRTLFAAGGPGSAACDEYSSDSALCNAAWHLAGQNGEPSSCFYEDGLCQGCGPNNQANGSCLNFCDPNAPVCADGSRTLFAGGAGTAACAQFDGDPLSCNAAWHVGGDGEASSCFYESGLCQGCGPNNEGTGVCVDFCEPGAPSCPDPARTLYAGGGAGSNACGQFDGDQASCEAAWHVAGQTGEPSSCFFDAGSCMGCGPNNQTNGLCLNACDPAQGCQDPARTIFAGGPQTGACTQFDGDLVSCLAAWHLGGDGTASACYWENGLCMGCGPNNESSGLCLDTCDAQAATCGDASRTFFLAGGPGSAACGALDGDQASCEAAWHLTGQTGQPASCYFTPAQECLGCGPNNETAGNCTNACVGGQPPGGNGCPLAPDVCIDPGVSVLLMKDKGGLKNRVVFRWVKGPALQQDQFGSPSPSTSNDVHLCIYEGSSRIMQMTAPSGGLPWNAINNGYRYVDRSLANDGILKIVMKTGAAGKTKVVMAGKGEGLPLPAIPRVPQASSYSAQIHVDGVADCVGKTFNSADVRANKSAGIFKALSK